MSKTIFPRRSPSVFQRVVNRLLKPVGGVGAVLSACVGMTLATGAGGCADSAAQPREITEMKSPGFARQWAMQLDIPSNDEVSQIFAPDPYVIVYTKKGRAYVLKRSDGTPLFGVEVPGGDAKLWPPVVLKERIVFPTHYTLEVYNLVGAHERSLSVGAAIRANCVGETNGVFVPTDSPNGGARMMRFDLTNPNISIPLWELQVWRGGVAAAPAVHTDTVYFAADVGDVYAVSSDRREPIWPLENNIFDARARIVAPLKVDDVGLYVSCTDGKFYCIHRTSGVVKWQYFSQRELSEAPVVMSDSVYIFDKTLGWTAVDKIDNPNIKGPQYNRKARWSSNDIKQVLSQDDKYVYVTDKSNHIVALDKQTGTRAFESARDDFFKFAANNRDATHYTVSRTGRVVAVRPLLKEGERGEVVRLEEDRSPEAALAGR